MSLIAASFAGGCFASTSSMADFLTERVVGGDGVVMSLSLLKMRKYFAIVFIKNSLILFGGFNFGFSIVAASLAGQIVCPHVCFSLCVYVLN